MNGVLVSPVPIQAKLGWGFLLVHAERRNRVIVLSTWTLRMFRRLPALLLATVAVLGVFTLTASAQVDANSSAPAVKVDADGTVHIPPQTVPLSSFLSPEAKAYVTYRLLHPDPPPDPDVTKERARIDAHLAPLLEKQKARYSVEIQPATIGGVKTLVLTPKDGIAPQNQHRVLINLHGGGFSVCAPTCGIIESIPIAGMGKIKVITVDYRQGPEFKFPAASEDVARVYSEVLKQYKPESIGIFGCSAGGMLTAQSVAWFQTHHLPRPGAIGIFCASAGDFGGDAEFTTPPLDGRMPPPPHPVMDECTSAISPRPTCATPWSRRFMHPRCWASFLLP